MRLLVFGAGAIGGYVGGHLAQAGHRVTFVARPAAAAQLQARGLTVRSARAGTAFTARDFGVAASAAEAFEAGDYDCVVLAIKSFDTAAAAAELAAATPQPPPVLCLQNGVDNEAQIAEVLGPQGVIAGTVTTPVSKPREGEILVEKERGLGIALGHTLSTSLIAVLNDAGLHTRAYAAAGPMKWSKLFTNLIGNATAAIVDLPVAKVFGDPRLFTLEAEMLRECLAVMRAYGYPVVNLPGVPVRPLAWAATRLPAAVARPLLRRLVGAGRGGKMPSLHVDLHAGRARSEVGWLHGAVARHGAERGVPTPVNRTLAATLAALHAGTLKLDDFRGRPEALVERVNKKPARS
jgi:2-dehydropantoate 2-reductase